MVPGRDTRKLLYECGDDFQNMIRRREPRRICLSNCLHNLVFFLPWCPFCKVITPLESIAQIWRHGHLRVTNTFARVYHTRDLVNPPIIWLRTRRSRIHPGIFGYVFFVQWYLGYKNTSARGSVGRCFLIIKTPRANPVGFRSLKSRKRTRAVGPRFLKNQETHESGRSPF